MIKKAAVKKATAKKAVKKKTALADPALQILQTSKCKTVSEKSELGYNLAINEIGILMIRISTNSGGGYWSREWIAFDDILNKVNDIPEDRPVTSIHLVTVFTGKSANTPGFLLAVLLKEGILELSGKKRQYKVSYEGVTKFQTKMDKLLSDKKK
jgi:hypothetical protein